MTKVTYGTLLNGLMGYTVEFDGKDLSSTDMYEFGEKIWKHAKVCKNDFIYLKGNYPKVATMLTIVNSLKDLGYKLGAEINGNEDTPQWAKKIDSLVIILNDSKWLPCSCHTLIYKLKNVNDLEPPISKKTIFFFLDTKIPEALEWSKKADINWGILPKVKPIFEEL